MMKRRGALLLACCVSVVSVSVESNGADPSKPIWRVLALDQIPADARLGEPRRLRDAYHPWSPPATKEAWERMAPTIRQRILVSAGLWPMPPKLPLHPVIHGRIDRGDYTIDKVYFASRPGHYVTGNLYRPKHISGKVPGVLCPHGHWPNGRFYDAGEKKAQDQIQKGAEQFESGARYPIQARMVQLARMGCIVFHYDMVGYADSQPISHHNGFTDVEAALWLHNVFGLQTFNSIRALDFLTSLPNVDAQRIGVTGASGGGTQTFVLCAVDPRPAIAFPAVMVSTGMQGGCVCENGDYLRIGLNNIAFAALFAPKPLAMSGAHDWTIDIETKGLPELKQIYAFYGKTDLVTAKCFSQFKHNYNQVSREFMYNWFNRHLGLGLKAPVRQQDFEPVSPEALSVFDADHPVPKDAKNAAELREEMRQVDRDWYSGLLRDSAKAPAEYRRIVGVAARILLDGDLSDAESVATVRETTTVANAQLEKGVLTRKGAGEQIPWLLLTPKNWNGTVVAWFDSHGKSALFDEKQKLRESIKRLLSAGVAVVSADVFQTGEYLKDAHTLPIPVLVDARYSGYTFGYNRPWLAQRVQDILTTLGWLSRRDNVQRIHLVGTGSAGSWVLLARTLSGERVDRTIADLHGFDFASIHDVDDPMFLPGALKYGGVGGLAALAAPAPLTISGVRGVLKNELQPLIQIYEATHGPLALAQESLTQNEIIDALTRK